MLQMLFWDIINLGKFFLKSKKRCKNAFVQLNYYSSVSYKEVLISAG